jgi:hypothetical protein
MNKLIFDKLEKLRKINITKFHNHIEIINPQYKWDKKEIHVGVNCYIKRNDEELEYINYLLPHADIYWGDIEDPNTEISYVSLHEASFNTFHKNIKISLTLDEKDEIIKFFNSYQKGFGMEISNEIVKANCWQQAVNIWINEYKEEGNYENLFNRDSNGNFIMPNYDNLSNCIPEINIEDAIRMISPDPDFHRRFNVDYVNQIHISYGEKLKIPHMHVEYDLPGNYLVNAAIRLDKAKYVANQLHKDSIVLSRQRKKNFVKYINSPIGTIFQNPKGDWCKHAKMWDYAVYIWLTGFPETEYMFPKDKNGNFIMPDYRNL